MRKNYFIALVAVLLCSPAFLAQNLETFESYTSGKPTSFTNTGQTFTIITNSCGPSNGGAMGVFIPGQSYNICTQSGTSTGSGYGVGTTCASSAACGSASNKFLDNGASTGTGQLYMIKSTPTTPFTMKYLYVYVSNNQAATSANSGVTFIGKNGGATIFTLNPGTLSTNSNGFTFIDFVAAGYGNMNIDELDIQGGASANYLAIDNFAWAAAVFPPTATGTQTNVLCNGASTGRASVSVTGGTAPYNYSWAPSGGTASLATGLAANNYTCTITDAASSVITKTFSITQPSALVTSTAITNELCNGGSTGSATITASGGTGAYTYTWSNGAATNSISGQMAGVYTATVTDANSCTNIRSSVITQPSALVTTTAVTNELCNGGSTGSATITASGGTGAYTYSWTTAATTSVITGVNAGVYTATVTDANSCTSIKSANITQPTAVSTATGYTNVFCYGMATGSGSVLASGGTSPYTYTWSTGATAGPTTGISSISGLSAGSYTVRATDASGCTSTIKTIVISQPAAALATSTAVTNVLCNGGSTGSATITASGGTPGYSYAWSTGATVASISGQMAGVYTCTVGDLNGCTTIKSSVITQPSALVTSTAVTTVLCNGGSTGSATITASGGTGAYTYSWTTGATTSSISGQVAGVYTATVTDANNCTSIKSSVITQPSALVTSTAVTNELCNGGSTGSATITASGGTGAYTYSWTTGATTGSISGQVAGVYTATVTDANNCTSIKSSVITQPSALVTSTAVTNELCNGGSTGSATITASGGTGAYTYSWTTGATTSSISGQVAGVYTATVTDANSCKSVKSANVAQPSSSLTATTGFTNVACFGGSTGKASVSVSGGTPSYAYSWAPSGGTGATATGLSAGNYTNTITDANGCTLTKVVTVSAPSSLAATTSFTNVTCFGSSTGAASVNVSGGTPSYAYSWAPSGGTAATATNLATGTYTNTITDANGCTLTKTVTVGSPAALSAITSITNVACFGGNTGAANVNVSGGTIPYTYSWTPSGGTGATASSLASGNYACVITDGNSCSVTKTVSISQPAQLTSTSSFTNISCNGGSTGAANVSVSGGTMPYAYSWAPSGGTGATASGLAAGGYTATTTDNNGCSVVNTFSITQPAALSFTTSSTNVSCNGGSNGTASISVSGGTMPYTYTWSPSGGNAASASGLSAGNYTCMITDGSNCTAQPVLTINQPSPITGTNTVANVTCSGGSNGIASVNVSGGTAPYTYSWLPSGGTGATANGLGAGTYTLSGMDANGCTFSFPVTITEPSAILATVTHTDVSCHGGSNGKADLSVSGGVPAYSYAWSPSGGSASSATGLMAGIYTCTITDNNTCSVTQTVAIGEPAALTAIASQTNVTCTGGGSDGVASVTVSGGTMPYAYTWSPSGGSASMATGLIAGTYICLVTDNNSCSISQTFTLTAPAPIAYTQSVAVCQGQSLMVGTSSYSAAGTYTDILTAANACDSTVTTILSINALPVLTTTSNTAICNGSSVTLTSVGATTYTWTNGVSNGVAFTPASTATYTVNATDANGCHAQAMVTVTVSPSPTVTAGATSTMVCSGQQTTLNGGGATTYTWSGGATNGVAFTPAMSTTYTVTGTSSNCTGTATVGITVSTCTGIDAQFNDSSVRVYPNPFSSSAVISIGGELASHASLSLDLYDNTGRLVKHMAISGAQTELSRGELATGLYFYNILDGRNLVSTGKLIIE